MLHLASFPTSYYWLKLAFTRLLFYSMVRYKKGEITSINIVGFASSYLTMKALLLNWTNYIDHKIRYDSVFFRMIVFSNPSIRLFFLYKTFERILPAVNISYSHGTASNWKYFLESIPTWSDFVNKPGK